MKLKALTLAVSMLVVAAAPARAEGRLWLGLNGGLGLPLGDFGDVASTGFNLGVAGDYPLNEAFLVGGEIGWHTFGGNDDFEKEQSAALGSPVDVSTRIVPLTVHAKWRVPAGDQVRPYLRGGLGLYLASTKFEVGSASDDESETDVGLQLGLGFDLKRTDRMALGVEGLWHTIFADPDNANLITLRAQALWAFGQ